MLTLFQETCFDDTNIVNNNNKDYAINFKNDFNKILIKILKFKDNLLGGWRFCNVFIGENSNTNIFFTIKITKNEAKSISKEINLLNILKGISGIPILINYINKKNNKAIWTNLCIPSLDKPFCFCDLKFSETTILLIAINIMKILKRIHEARVIHRDLKPANICYGSFSCYKFNSFDKTITLIDFGLGKIYSTKNLRNNEIKNNNYFVGTPMFASTSALSGLLQLPKDNVESLFYVMIYLKNGTLPWLKFKKEDKR